MENLKEIIDFSNNVEFVFIATSGKDCTPNIDTVKSLQLIRGRKIAIKEWLCDRTIENLSENKNCTLLVWDEKKYTGYQLTGEAVEMRTLAFLDGYKSGIKEKESLPQVLWGLKITIDKIREFSHEPKEKLRIITKDDKNITDRMT